MQERSNFLDSKNILALVIIFVVFFGWQKYLSHKYPNYGQPAPKAPEAGQTVAEPAPNEPRVENTTGAAVAQPAKLAARPVAQKILGFENEEIAFELSSAGMTIQNLRLKKITDRNNEPMAFGASNVGGLYGMSLENGEVVPFSVERVSEYVFKGTAEIGKTHITRVMTLDPLTLSFSNTVEVFGSPLDYKNLRFSIHDQRKEVESSFLFPSFDHQEFVVHYNTTSERTNANQFGDNGKFEKSYPSTKMAAIGSQYFAMAYLDRSEIIPQAIARGANSSPVLDMELVYSPPASADRVRLQFVNYTGPKDHSVLKAIDSELIGVINFGFFKTISEMLLSVLRWFHNYVSNWGVAIILLTILVRLLVLPFNIASYKSMKKMQKIQPMMQSLRERYKEDPQTMQKETMNLMREHKVNPLGGCLPMLLQMPVFFALYQVLGQSIELYKAPFFGWIQDLSLKDPYYVLPVLMGAAMWLQTKITPNTMDPTQAKIMQFLPIVFSLMMVSLPSGLTLYIFVSTIFGVIQQQMFMRDRSTALSVTAAKV